MYSTSTHDELIIQLYNEAKIVQFGSFTLKSGHVSPVYVDLRRLVTFPSLRKIVATIMWDYIKENNLLCEATAVGGAPYAAWPLATRIADLGDVPEVLVRKEAKGYGGKKLVEGAEPGTRRILLIEDVITTGGSVLESVQSLRGMGLAVSDVVVFLDREQGGIANLAKFELKVHSILKLTTVVDVLLNHAKITPETKEQVIAYLKQNSSHAPVSVENGSVTCFAPLSLQERSQFISHPVSKQLLEIMREKESNLCVAADLPACSDILTLAKNISSEICALKLHTDAIKDFNEDFLINLRRISSEGNFLLFEAIMEDHVDIIIVGRGVTQAEDPVAAAKAYRSDAWSAYLQSVNFEGETGKA